MVLTVFVVVVCYFIGCFNTAYFISKTFKKKDIRDFGSGNAGSANMLRNFGAGAAAVVFVTDVLKGFLAVQLSHIPGVNAFWGVLGCSLSVVCGHNWPVTLKFRGGKGVATTAGVAFGLAPLITLIALVIAFVIIGLARLVSLGALIGIFIASLAITLFSHSFTSIIVMWILFALSLFQHRSNISRLIRGEERRLGEENK
jgi:glycerol-3-phosphate acyltransferase PlsY